MSSLSISRRDARRSALTGLVDYAGLFPPAALPMDDAVAEYRDARSGPTSWMVDRFICSASRLEELVGAMSRSMTAGEVPWRITVTARWVEDLTADAGAVRTFVDTVGTAANVELVECRVPGEVAGDPAGLVSDASQILRAYQAMPFFELPWHTAPNAAMDALVALREESGRNLGVKLRTGGLEADLFPSPEEAGRFISAAAARMLPLKATAGLHHPYRHIDAETGFHHHGFVNVLAATALAHGREPETTVAAVLADEDPDHFTLDKGGLTWLDYRVGATELEAMRSGLFVSYGSCSFDEPVADLTALGILPLEVSA
jgi:hypothetical protein